MASLDATVPTAQVESVAPTRRVVRPDSFRRRAAAGRRHAGAAFECGTGEREKQGRVAFGKLMGETPRPLLDPAEWATVKTICAGS